jgi:hypothetical protein
VWPGLVVFRSLCRGFKTERKIDGSCVTRFTDTSYRYRNASQDVFLVRMIRSVLGIISEIILCASHAPISPMQLFDRIGIQINTRHHAETKFRRDKLSRKGRYT